MQYNDGTECMVGDLWTTITREAREQGAVHDLYRLDQIALQWGGVSEVAYYTYLGLNTSPPNDSATTSTHTLPSMSPYHLICRIDGKMGKRERKKGGFGQFLERHEL